MKPRAVNATILVFVVLASVSGLGSFLVGETGGRWVFWMHRGSGLALVLLLVWKVGIAERSYKRRGLRLSTVLAGVAGVLLLGVLGTGVLWATVGLPRVPVPVFGSWTVLSLHVALALVLVPLFLVHLGLRWPRLTGRDLIGRRAALRTLGLLAAGLAIWRVQEFFTPPRRFTGSREEASFTGDHPVTNWLSDPIPQIDAGSWRLRVGGAVEDAADLSYEEVLALGDTAREALLDCTGGWYTVQRWRGTPVSALLREAGVSDEARSVLVRSSTGYARRFSLEEADELLLATHVADGALSAGHGFPLRLVAPRHRGYAWVKWVVGLEVSGDPAWLEPPLPLQ